MAAGIALRPSDDRGREILYELEEQTEMKPTELLEGGTRSYYLSATDADVKAARRSSSAPASTALSAARSSAGSTITCGTR
jgi:hypothetical protein